MVSSLTEYIFKDILLVEKDKEIGYRCSDASFLFSIVRVALIISIVGLLSGYLHHK